MKIYDCFIFNHEVEILEIRLNILDEFVDKFILTEGDKTFSGKPKKSFYLENKHRFKKWEDKIIHNFITIPECESPWDREIYSRNSMIKLDNIFEEDDLILTSDIDEIPNPEILSHKNEWISNDKHFTFQQRCYFYYLNNFYSENWFGTRACTYNFLKSQNKTVDDIRESTENENELTGNIITNGGWHFTYCGGEEKIKQKIDSFCDLQYNVPKVTSNIHKNLENNQDIFYRNWIHYQKVSIDESFPEYIVKNKEKYSHLIK
jgi:beta-1,4-mannosyl-glycoprotein beta-1,4-N-acetylglucosaminyltransferase